MNIKDILDLNTKGLALFNITTADIFIRLIMALLLSAFVASIYNRYYKERENSSGFTLVILGCPLIITISLMALSNSISSAFGLFAALSIIRFRTPIKNVKEMVFIFLSISIGICCGVGTIKIAIIGTFFICLVMFALNLIRPGLYHSDYLLRVYIDLDSHERFLKNLSEIMEKEGIKGKLIEVKNSIDKKAELLYSVTSKKEEQILKFATSLKSDKDVTDLFIHKPLNENF
jgi:uncharacterized membrane protein YhiD involved in acid resistance